MAHTDTASKVEMTLDEARAHLAKARGKQYWRSLNELSDSDAFQRMIQREFPRQAVESWDPVDRRDFMKLMGASLALAGLTACTKQHPEKIVPYVIQPEEIIPGKPLFYATALTMGGVATGLLVESHMGRPTKLEGNPEHPGSLGSSDVFTQAAILGMYDPDRSQTLINRGRVGSWDIFRAEMGDIIGAEAATMGAGLRILTETVNSPTLASQLDEIQKKFPLAKVHQYEPVNRDNSREGTRIAFGEMADPVYKLDRAKVILSLDSDFLTQGPGHVRYARDFAAARHVESNPEGMARFYAVESSITVSGASADHRLPVKPSHVESIARAIAAEVGVAGVSGDAHGHEAWVAALAKDLKAHRGEVAVLVGDHQPAAVHAIAHAIHDALDSIGSTVTFIELVEAKPVLQNASLKELVADMQAGKVKVLLILGGNPVYNAPADLKFADALEKVGSRVHLSLYEDETSALCQWHVPEAYFLEAWSDARGHDGTASIVQPLVEPLYGGKSAHEVLNILFGKATVSAYDTIRDYWRGRSVAADFESFWRKSVHDGVIPGTARSAKSVAFNGSIPEATAAAGGGFEVSLLPDISVYDGRFANNAWLQEVPRPLTKIVWDNALLVSPATAAKNKWSTDSIVSIEAGGNTLNAPVWVTPGHPDDCGTLHLGYGRTRAGRTGTDVGVNAYALLSSASALVEAKVSSVRGSHKLVVTQEHHSMEGRGHLRSATVAAFKANPTFVNDFEHFGTDPITIYRPDLDLTKGDQWGMVINLSACVGCNACVIACQAENNIPVVGKDQVRRNREMHWIRIDRYYEGDAANPKTHLQPLTCMQCENAPCESVCPVAATVHSNDGLNQMIYNRCVGTRYCSNNCPYKVRRFNFYKFADHETPSLKLMRNPDVTVRSRGVMEKCTYCVQRISQARITAKKDGRSVRDGEIVTACQQACPTRAITFGNINDAESHVSKLRANPLHYGMLRELNTKPRTTYLARILNPNPELEPAEAHGGDSHGGHGES